MTLSICLITDEPAGRVAATLERVTALADEIVIAADARVGEAGLAAYGGLADRVVAIEYAQAERQLAWLYAQCTGDWILHLDGDEVPSAALARRLPELLARRDVRQVWIRRAWLDPSGRDVLEDEPWCSDCNNRLLRNDGSLRLRGVQHAQAEPAEPAEWVAEPLYHLALAATTEARRRDRAIRYEVAEPLRTAAGGGRLNEAFYLPELRASVRRSSVPAEDRELIDRALAARVDPPPAPAPAAVTLAETDRWWEGRGVLPGTHRAAIEPLYPIAAMTPHEGRRVLVRVANQGTERWPWTLEARPAIRMSYRWLRPDGSVHAADGVRTPFPRTVAPGETVVVPLHVVAPPEPGDYVLHVDVVHDEVTWFDCPWTQPVRVGAPDALPPVGERLTETHVPRRRLRLRLRPGPGIPHTLHRVWLGSNPLPEPMRRFGEGFAALHPGWTVRLWGDADLAALGIGDAERALARGPSELSNLVRYEVLHRLGGVYADTDVEFKRPFDELAESTHAFAALELPGRLGSAVLGAAPGHRVFARAAALARSTLGLGTHSPDANGPYLLSLVVEQEGGVTILGPGTFYPYLWDEPERAGEEFPDALAVHRWALSWRRTPVV